MNIYSNISLPLDHNDSYLWFRSHLYIKKKKKNNNTYHETTSTKKIVMNDKIGIIERYKGNMRMYPVIIYIMSDYRIF